MMMDCTYEDAAPPPPEIRSKPRERRQSRIRASFFGNNKRGSIDLASETPSRSPSRLTIGEGCESDHREGGSFFDRRKLRKASSKISLRSMPSMALLESPLEGGLGYRSLSDLLRGGRTHYARRSHISNPFNFAHVTHANSRDFDRLHQSPQQELVRSFGKVVRESSLPLRRRATLDSEEGQPPSSTLSPYESLCELAQVRSEEGPRYACPLTPPPRTSSRHFLRSLEESPSEDGPDDAPPSPRTVPHPVTTSDDPAPALTPAPAQIRQKSFLSGRNRPLSQASDTLSGSFTVPPSPSQAVSSCRVSRRLSVLMKTSGAFTGSEFGTCLDSWEEDIDWCYENQVDADCEFDWEGCGSRTTTAVVEASDVSMPLRESSRGSATKGQFVNVDKRITGTFEDKLLLPPSPRLPSSPGFPPYEGAPTTGVADDGFEPDNETTILRAADTAQRHRSLGASTLLTDIAPGRAYRDELTRVARKLDEHIAALNQEMPSLGPFVVTSTNTFPPTATPPPSLLLRSRARADSEATCVTLCSDTETVTPTDSVEIVTPSSSAHSSLVRLSAIPGFGDPRGEKGVLGAGFAAAALPGVVEFGPDAGGPVGGEVFVHFI